MINVWVSMTWISLNKTSSSDEDQMCSETIVHVFFRCILKLQELIPSNVTSFPRVGGWRLIDLVSLPPSLLLSVSACEDPHRDLQDPELQAHVHKESLGQGRGTLINTGEWCGVLKGQQNQYRGFLITEGM